MTNPLNPTDIRIGVIGVGKMGSDHVQRIVERTKGAQVTVITDYFRETAEKVSATAPGSRVVDTWEELIAADDVDAVIIASPGQFHKDQAIACIKANKPVLCEKPLAMTPEDAYEVVQVENDHGASLVSLGFMRRFDAEYVELKDALDAGELGETMVMNCKHRNAEVGPEFKDEMMVYDSAVHEIDAINYFFGEPIVEVQTITPTPSTNAHPGQHDPMIFIFRTESGRIITDELYVNTKAGYEVRTEILGSKGISTIGLGISRVTTHQAGSHWGGNVPLDFRPRFIDAYDAEVQAWVRAIKTGHNVATRSATAWDGYVGAAVCAAAHASLTSTTPVKVELKPRP
ncbi:Gfo/Idh/MocA family oxidoreductase [Corynebacterium sp. SA-MJD20WY100]|uniref:Gfo/Idh/MocA family protein n=1 Tax=Corynebacterium sp. SA-MJD20WY100 TaxID=3142969 RepID=UPI003221B176